MNEHPKYYITYMKFHDDAIHDSATVIHKEKMMNERIRELALLAHSDALESYRERMKTEFAGDVIFSDMYDQKFAKLIVEQCVSMCGSQADKKNMSLYFDLPTEPDVKYPATEESWSVKSQYNREYNFPK